MIEIALPRDSGTELPAGRDGRPTAGGHGPSAEDRLHPPGRLEVAADVD